MNIAVRDENKNFIIAFLAMVFIAIIFLVAFSIGFNHQLGKLIDQVLIQLGLMPEHIINKLMMNKGLSYSYVSVNKAVYILINLIVGFITFKLICKRGTKYSGWIYGIFMTLIFILIGSVFTISSGDPFNWICVAYGIPVTLFIQIILSILLFNQKKNRNNLY